MLKDGVAAAAQAEEVGGGAAGGDEQRGPQARGQRASRDQAGGADASEEQSVQRQGFARREPLFGLGVIFLGPRVCGKSRGALFGAQLSSARTLAAAATVSSMSSSLWVVDRNQAS